MKLDDFELEAQIESLKIAIQRWAERNDLWHDAGFKSYAEHVDGEQGELPVVLVMYFEGPLQSVIDGSADGGLQDEFYALVEEHGFHFENNDGVSGWIYPDEDDIDRVSAFADYFRWQWICSLIEPDCADVYEELYQHFARRPEDLQRLDWRQFETLLFRLFQNQGFRAELGPGTNDGGADVRLWRDPLGDVCTLVQVKRYRPDRKIPLDAVAALRGVVANEGASHGVFVTTSSYLPSARRFAERSSGVLTLKSAADVVEWCRTAGEGVISDKSTLVSPESVRSLLVQATHSLENRVLHASTGYNTVANSFALVIKETKYAALLMSLPSEVIAHDGYGQRGVEIPKLNQDCLRRLNSDHVWRVRKGPYGYWDGRNLYSPWDGKPAHFDICD